MNGQVLTSDVAARDVQAATSHNVSVDCGRRQSRSFVGGGSGQGESRRGKDRVCSRLSRSEKHSGNEWSYLCLAELRYKMSVSLKRLMNNWFMLSDGLSAEIEHRYKMSGARKSMHQCDLRCC